MVGRVGRLQASRELSQEWGPLGTELWSRTKKGPGPPSLAATMSITFLSAGPPWDQRPPWERRGARREGKTLF